MTVPVEQLKPLRLLAGLEDATLSEIAALAFLRAYSPNDLILLEGEPSEAVYFVLEGEVRIFRTSAEGRQQVLTRLGQGGSFNLVPSLRPIDNNPASVRAQRPTRLLMIRNPDFLRLLKTRADFSFAILQNFASRLVELTSLLENIALHSVRGRLARFLLDRADQGLDSARWTQDEIAEQLGTVRDVVGRTLRGFLDEGLLRRERQKIVLLDRAALEAIAEN